VASLIVSVLCSGACLLLLVVNTSAMDCLKDSPHKLMNGLGMYGQGIKTLLSIAQLKSKARAWSRSIKACRSISL